MGNFLYMTSGEEPDPYYERVLNVCLILHADHTMNASTFAGRVVGSTAADPYTVVSSALGALSGPLHGGANEDVMALLDEIGSVKSARTHVENMIANKIKIPGFGHRVYKTMDPRATILKGACDDVLAELGVTDPLLDIAKNLVDAALLAGVQHFVIESAAGVTQDNHSMNKYGNVMLFKLKAENYLRDSGLPYTMVRPGGLESADSEGKTIALKQGDDMPNHGGFSRADIAALMIAAVGNPDAYNKAFEPIYDEEATAGGWQPAFSDLLTDTELSQQEP